MTIIIPHLGRSNESRLAISECTLSLFETEPGIKKIIVINGIVFEGDFDLFANRENTSIMTLSEQGQCKAVNAAVATTNTPWIMVTNDDMIYPPGWFDRLLGIAQTGFPKDNGDIRCISPKLIEPRAGAPTFEEFFAGGAGGDFDKQKWLKFAENYTGRSSNSVRTGFNLPFLISHELWDLIGGYDVNFDPWGSNSDSDLEYKIRLAGVQPLQNTNCPVYHFSQTSGTFEPQNNSWWQNNFAYFEAKWGFPRTDTGIWEANFHMPTKEEGRKFKPEWEGHYGNTY